MSKKEVNNTIEKGDWSTGKLVIGIISMVLFVIITFQSCAAGIGNALEENGSTSGSAGFLCAICMLTAGIVAVATKNKKTSGGSIAATILYFIGTLCTLGMSGTFGDLAIWGAISFDFGLVCLGSIFVGKEKLKDKSKLITIAVIVLSIIAFIVAVA